MDNDQNSAGIAMSKFQADGARYFGLFDPHIPSGLTGNILLLSLGNLDCVAKAIGKNPGASYTVVDDAWMLDCLRALPPSGKMEFIEDLDVYNIIKGLDMKFDCIIMNPPYQRNLHLKVLAEAIKHLKDDGVCVNLSPVRWLQDPFAPYNKRSDYCKFEDLVSKKIKTLDIFSGRSISNIFADAAFTMNIGVYVCDKNGGYNYKHSNPIIDKIIKKINLSNWSAYSYSKQYKLPQKPYTIIISGIHSTEAKYSLVCNTYESQLKTKAPKLSSHNACNTGLFSFNTEGERKNFYDCYRHPFIEYICSWWRVDVNVNSVRVPYFNDYSHKWNYEDFYCYFELTDDEIKIVEDTMKKYAAK